MIVFEPLNIVDYFCLEKVNEQSLPWTMGRQISRGTNPIVRVLLKSETVNKTFVNDAANHSVREEDEEEKDEKREGEEKMEQKKRRSVSTKAWECPSAKGVTTFFSVIRYSYSPHAASSPSFVPF